MPVTNYIWDMVNDCLLAETDGSGATTVVYTNEPVPYGRLISQHRGGVTSYYHFDAVGSTRMLTNEAQETTDTYVYTAFGELVASTGSTENPFRYVGQFGYYYDGEALGYYVRERRYEPKSAAWLSQDRVDWRTGHSTYVYASNSPTIVIDPTGAIGIRFSGSLKKEQESEFAVSGTCGKPFSGVAEIHMDTHSVTDGWIVQKITFQCRVVDDCEHCPITDETPGDEVTLVFWEAVFLKGEKGVKKGTRDLITSECVADTCGYKVKVGEAKFFFSTTTKIDKDSTWHQGEKTFGKEPCTVSPTAAGKEKVYWTDQEPKWWSMKPNKSEKEGERSVKVEWNCCNGGCDAPEKTCNVTGKASPKPK